MSDLLGRTTVVVGASRGRAWDRSRVRRGWRSGGRGRPDRTGACRACHYQREHPDRGRGCGRRDGAMGPAGPVRAGGSHPGRRRRSCDASAPVPDLGDVVHWHNDVKIAFNWLRGALLKPLRPGSRVVVMSSGAAINGSPVSGGYAGSKATQRFIAEYAQEESRRAGLNITVTAVMPRMTPLETWAGWVFGRTRPAAARPRRHT